MDEARLQRGCMRRREFIILLGCSAAWPSEARAQQLRKLPRVGILMPGPPEFSGGLKAFYRGIHELGYTEEQNIILERRFGEWKGDRLSERAAELVRLNVDVIVAWSTPSIAAKRATNTIPIVAAVMADPVGDELVVSLSRPGGNVTGTTFLGPELVAKRLGFLKETIPDLSRVAALWHPGAYGKRTMENLLQETEDAARALGVQLQLVRAFCPEDFDSAFSAMRNEKAGAFIVLPKPNAVHGAQTHHRAGGCKSVGWNLPSEGVRRRGWTYVLRSQPR
jgi:putative ABC transport system substrate-binding protein